MRLQQVVITWTRKTNTLLVVKSIGFDISHIEVAKIWSKCITFLLVTIHKTHGIPSRVAMPISNLKQFTQHQL
jgi:hypothetical protein